MRVYPFSLTPPARKNKEVTMLRTALTGVLGTLCLASSVAAQTCPAYTYALTNGQTADASQVMSNFNSIRNCANTSLAPLASPVFTGNMLVGSGTLTNVLTVGSPTEYQGLSINNGSHDLVQLIGSASYNDDGTLVLLNGGTASARFYAYGTSYLNGGNFGVGLTNPTYTFQVNGSAAGSGAWINLSDARMKTNVEEISGAVDLVRRLRGVRFRWRSAAKGEVGSDLQVPLDRPQIGFVAQEVEMVVPEAVVPPKPGSSDFYGLKEADLVPVLVEAIKEQQGEIAKLQTDIAGLRAGN